MRKGPFNCADLHDYVRKKEVYHLYWSYSYCAYMYVMFFFLTLIHAIEDLVELFFCVLTMMLFPTLSRFTA